jgi:quinol monooxygenase YgiN
VGKHYPSTKRILNNSVPVAKNWHHIYTKKEISMKIVNVLAIITANPGSRYEVLSHFRSIEAAVKAEVGCIEYQATVDFKNASSSQAKIGEDTFVVIEKWESLDALKAHSASRHMADFAEKTKDMIANKVVHVLSPL